MTRKLENVPEKEVPLVKALFREKGFMIVEKKGGGEHSKFVHFSGDNLPDIFWMKYDQKKPPAYHPYIHIDPETPREQLIIEPAINDNAIKEGKNKYIFFHSNLGNFPKEEAQEGEIKSQKSCEALRLCFENPENLSKILDNLIEIKRKVKSSHSLPASHNQIDGAQAKSESESSLDSLVEKTESENSYDGDVTTRCAVEGGKTLVFSPRYERDQGLRESALKIHGYVCGVCGFNFEKSYGELGKDFIEVHHIIPVSEGVRENNPANLIPLCPNCHRMIHRLLNVSRAKNYENAIEELKAILERHKEEK